ncbi:ABC transporter ATP-binding protein [Candidatus Dependentiae bacterium]|nr:ABC transporter ATP-binding protein [Candidatus Dependentiae bacterium]
MSKIVPQKIEAKNIHKTFESANKKLHVIQDISETFEQGKTYAITGASGSGKSTLLHILGKLDTPTSGKITGAQSIGFVFQFHYLINELTVLENIMLMGLIKDKSKASCKDRAQILLKHVGLTDKANSFPFELSGGEQQRISILRAIFNKPKFLLADEPTGNLDATNAANIVDLLLACREDWQMGIILCSHDKNVYERMDYVFELVNGKLCYTGALPKQQ